MRPHRVRRARTAASLAACGALVAGAAAAPGPPGPPAPPPPALALGDGPVLVVARPTALDIDFGTIPRDHLASRDVVVHNAGDAPLELVIEEPAAPFGAPASATLPPGGTAPLALTCRGDTAAPRADGVVTLMAAGAAGAAGSPAAIGVHCAIADTRLAITPAALDFGEVRRGAPAASLPVTLANPGPGAMLVEGVRLAGAPPALRFAAPPPEAQTLDAGESLALTLSLATSAPLLLAGVRLELDVDGERVELPVSGEVVTPAARVSPVALELGTACVGTLVTGEVRLVNSGTATLQVQRPELDRGFMTGVARPASYPSPLPPGQSAVVSLAPAVSAVGPIAGTLTWDVDAPAGPFAVPIALRFIDAGTAISPRGLGFGPIEVERASPRQFVTLENCDSRPVTLELRGLAAEAGGIEAWEVSPLGGTRTLGPRETLAIGAVFRPRRPGRHAALLELAVDGAPDAIELSGEGLGETEEATSFYACDCRGGGAPDAGAVAPLALAAWLALRPRRRGARTASAGR